MHSTQEQQYLDLLQELIVYGTVKSDRTGTGTLSKFGHQMRFNLAEGFPLLTTKKVHFPSVVSELLWFLQGKLSTDYLNENSNRIWNPNAEKSGQKNPVRFNSTNIGNMYGMAWRMLPCEPHGMVTFKRYTYEDDYTQVHTCPEIDKYYLPNPKIKYSNTAGKYFVLGKQGNKFVIKFEATGSYKVVNTLCKSIKDNYLPNTESVGYLGDNYDWNNPTHKNLYRKWQDMLIRCYNPRDNPSSYGKIHVCKRWLNFSNFLKDAYSLWGFQEYVDSGYTHQLDKDYRGSDYYSPDTCLFLPSELNKSLNSGGTGLNTIYEYQGNFFHSRESLQASRGRTRKASLPKDIIIHQDTATHVVRPIIWIDQLDRAINLIKTDPNSRRIVIDAWNPRGEENASLGICHPMFQFYVQDGKLSCQLYQRSADTFLGVPFNIASYALLTHIVAQYTGLAVGDFVWVGGDVHLYKNHTEQAALQLSREGYPLPQIKLDIPIGVAFDQLEHDHFTLEGYQSHPAIKAEVAV